MIRTVPAASGSASRSEKTIERGVIRVICIVSSLSKAGDIGADSSDVNYTELVRGLAD
jgi:hypothetical protein